MGPGRGEYFQRGVEYLSNRFVKKEEENTGETENIGLRPAAGRGPGRGRGADLTPPRPEALSCRPLAAPSPARQLLSSSFLKYEITMERLRYPLGAILTAKNLVSKWQ